MSLPSTEFAIPSADSPTADSPGGELELFAAMVLSRAIEDRMHALLSQGSLRGRLVSGRGQEAIPVGVTSATLPDDAICPVHRDLGAHLMRGSGPEVVFLSYFGKLDSPSRGRDGDVHFGEWSRGVFPMVSHLPDSWPIALGLGLARKLARQQSAVVAFCGDGATSTGAWHETLNASAVWQTPNVWVVENNQYAYSTPAHLQYHVDELVRRADAYGMPGVRVDGNDVMAVRGVADEALERARSGGGPTLIEAITMRVDGHAAHDPARYVPAELIEEWRQRDPILLSERRLLATGTTSEEIAAIRARARDEVAAAFERARAAADPTGDTVELGVFSQPPDAPLTVPEIGAR